MKRNDAINIINILYKQKKSDHYALLTFPFFKHFAQT